MTELSNYGADGKLTSTIKYTYDANGVLTKEETLLGNGTVDMVSTVKTDAKGNKIEQEDVRPNGNIMFNYKHVFTYDQKGQILERVAFRGNGALLFKYNFTYDDRGNRIEWLQTGPNNTIVGKVVYKFNVNNNMIEEIHFKGDGGRRPKTVKVVGAPHKMALKNGGCRDIETGQPPQGFCPLPTHPIGS